MGAIADQQGHGLMVAAGEEHGAAGLGRVCLEAAQQAHQAPNISAPVEVVAAADEGRPGWGDPVQGVIEDAGRLQGSDESRGDAVRVAEGPDRPVIGDAGDEWGGHVASIPRLAPPGQRGHPGTRSSAPIAGTGRALPPARREGSMVVRSVSRCARYQTHSLGGSAGSQSASVLTWLEEIERLDGIKDDGFADRAVDVEAGDTQG